MAMPEWTDDFLENMRLIKAETHPQTHPQAQPQTHAHTNRPYVDAAYTAEIAELETCPAGNRNHVLNIVALKLARLPIDRDQLHNDLIQACLANGLIRDDGRPGVEATIKSAFSKADLDGPRVIPERPTLNSRVTEVDAADLTEDEARDLHQLAVQRRAYELRVNDEARVLFQTQQAIELGQARPRPALLHDFLAIPDEDAHYRITDLLPTGGNALLAAQQKAGKTSMIANLIRALADGGWFLDKFNVEPVQRLTLIDNELDERMLRRWLREQNIINVDRVQVISLKGNISTFDIHNDHARAQWAQDIRGSQFVILDCLRPCLDSLGLSEDKDAGRFLVAWDALKREAGVSESVVVHHMGHGQERSRGDSRLLDWPDVNWKIVKESQSETVDREELDSGGGRRFFAAHGRDVLVAEGLLKWSEVGRTLTYIDGGRREVKAIDAVDAIREIMSDPNNRDGLSHRALKEKLRVEGIGKTIATRAINKAVDGVVLLEESGARNAKILTLNPSEGR